MLDIVCDVMAINTCNHNPAHTSVLMVYKRALETKEAPVVRTPAENARPLVTVMVQTEKIDEEPRRDLFAVGVIS